MNIQLKEGHTLNLWFIYIYWTDGLLWFRWFGKYSGYKIKDTRKYDLLFSERTLKKGIHIANWYIVKLKNIKWD